ncbi:MAG: homoserine dehydrogenase [Candidatus Omnitrophota bacterium]
MKSVNIGLVGLGTIGKGVVDAVISNRDLIAVRTGVSLCLIAACDKDDNAFSGLDMEKYGIKRLSTEELLADKDVDIVVELIGGVHPAKEIILRALKNKKHVVTANKALLSECWNEIFETATDNGVFVNFEASVGGAIPVIRTIRESLAANRINTVYGILNGTTNFILTTMESNGVSFAQALELAQQKGIAERDPELDISGKDSAHKLAILSMLCFGISVSPDDIYTEGINHITAQDIINAEKWGYSIKLLAIAKSTSGGVEVRVHPTLLSNSHLLTDVRGADNAVFIVGDLVGESLLFGKGAGRKPTTSSVMGDIVDIAKHIVFCGKNNPVPYYMKYAPEGQCIIDMDKLEMSYYLRFSVTDKPGVLAGISSVLSENGISIASVSQEERREGETVPVIILTHKAQEGRMRNAIKKIDDFDFIMAKTVVIRMEDRI